MFFYFLKNQHIELSLIELKLNEIRQKLDFKKEDRQSLFWLREIRKKGFPTSYTNPYNI